VVQPEVVGVGLDVRKTALDDQAMDLRVADLDVAMPFAIHPAAQRADVALADTVVLGQGEKIAVGIEDFRIVVQLRGDLVDQLAPGRQPDIRRDTGTHEENQPIVSVRFSELVHRLSSLCPQKGDEFVERLLAHGYAVLSLAQFREGLRVAVGNEYVVPFEPMDAGRLARGSPAYRAFKEVPLAAIAIADQRPGYRGWIIQPADQFAEPRCLQPFPEGLRQTAGKTVQAVHVERGMLDEDRLADQLECHQQLVAHQLLQVLGTHLLNLDRKGQNLDAAWFEDVPDFGNFLLIDRGETDFHADPEYRLPCGWMRQAMLG